MATAMKGRCRDCEHCIPCDCNECGFCIELSEVVALDDPFPLGDDGCCRFEPRSSFDPMWWYDENLEYRIAQDMAGEFITEDN